MKTKYLILALLVIVAVFVTKGFYVTRDVREANAQSYQQFEVFSNVLHPLIDSYGMHVVDATIKTANGQLDVNSLGHSLEAAQANQKRLLAQYVSIEQGVETLDDKELYIRANDVTNYIETLRGYCAANDLAALRETLANGTLYGNFDPIQSVLHRIGNSKLKASEDYKHHVESSLKEFERVMTLSGILIGILAVLAIRYKERPIRRRSNQKNFKARATAR